MAAKNDYILTDLQIITSVTRARDIKRAELRVLKAKLEEQIRPLEDEVNGLTDKLSRLRGDGWVRLADIEAGNVPGVTATGDTSAAPAKTNGSHGTTVSPVLRHTIETVIKTAPAKRPAPASPARKAKPSAKSIPAPRPLPALGTTAKLKAARLAAASAPADAPKAKAAAKPKAAAPKAAPAAAAPAAATPAPAAGNSGQEAEILAVIKASGPIATKEIAAKLDVEARTIRRAIGALRTSGQIVAQGEGRAVQFTAA